MSKLSGKTPPVTRREVEQCFHNRLMGLLEDTRVTNKTIPPTLWFIAPTNKKRLLKIVYVQDGSDIYLKTAYDPNPVELQIYIDNA